MTQRQILFAALVLVLFGVLLWTALIYARRSHRVASSDWRSLLLRLKETNRANITMLAMDLVDEQGRLRDPGLPELSAGRVRELVGSLEALETLEANSKVFIDMAAYVQRWYPQARLTAAELRQSASAVTFHIDRLRAAQDIGKGNLEAWMGEYGQRAAVIYYLMTQRLIELFTLAHMPELSELQAKL